MRTPLAPELRLRVLRPASGASSARHRCVAYVTALGLAVALLERLSQHVLASSQPPPRTAGDLYALWVESPLVAEDYPAMLELWGAGPERPLLAELQLAQLDLKPGLLSALARSAVDGPCIERLEAIPGVHYVLVVRLNNGTVLTVAVGPRTRWLPPNRVARFLRGDPGVVPPYTITLSLPIHGSAVGGTVDRRRSETRAQRSGRVPCERIRACSRHDPHSQPRRHTTAVTACERRVAAGSARGSSAGT